MTEESTLPNYRLRIDALARKVLSCTKILSFLAAVLVCAAFGKMLAVTEQWRESHALPLFGTYTISVALTEFSLAGYLIWRSSSAVLAAVLFCLGGMLWTFWEMTSGSYSCGCFGGKAIPAEVAFGLDLFMAALLIPHLSRAQIVAFVQDLPMLVGGPLTILAMVILVVVVYS